MIIYIYNYIYIYICLCNPLYMYRVPPIQTKFPAVPWRMQTPASSLVNARSPLSL